MTAFYKGKAVQQVDALLCEGEMYSLEEVCKIIRKYGIKPQKKKKNGK